VNRMPTGVPGLDEVLGGGFEPGSTVLIAGAPGTGKTILAQQICFANATDQHKAVYYTTLSEPHTKLVRHLEQFAFFAPDSLGRNVEHVHLGDLLRKGPGAGLEPLVSEVVRRTLETQPAIVVIDSAKMLRDFAVEPDLRTAFYDLTSRIGHTPTALLLLGEYTPDEMASDVEFSLVDGIIQLSYQPREPVDRRWLRVVKLRGGSHREGKHTFRIGSPRGFEVFPRIETLIPAEMAAVSGRVSSGNPHLDELMGGGPAAGDATLILGPSGAGKTIFALRYIAEGLEHGEDCLFVTFQDTSDQLVAMAAVFGWDLGTARATGRLKISHVPMGSLDLDVVAAVVREELATRPVRRVVIDSLAELAAAAREAERFPAYKRSLIGLIRADGASLVVTSETTTLGPPADPFGGLMFLFHNVIQLRYIERDSQVGRALNIGKMRNSQHDMGLHSFTITEDGMTIGDRLEGTTGLLGWSALRTKEEIPPN
jgi:circadian clock protein KaiC